MSINYTSRDYSNIRQNLINYAKSNYDIEFTPASIDLLFVDMLSGVGDMLSYNTDKKFLETQLESAEERISLLAMARTYGLKIPNKKPSITVCEFKVRVPVYGDIYDKNYAPIIKAGAQVYGSSQTFETVDDIDFNDDFSVNGVPNRKIIPIINQSTEEIIAYDIVKQEVVVNGVTKVGFKNINSTNHKPFLTITIPDENVLSVEQVIQVPSTVTSPSNDMFYDDTYKFYEVDSLIENKIFLDDSEVTYNGVKKIKGKYKEVSKRFITEYDNKGKLKIIFGGGIPTDNALELFNESLNSGFIPKIKNYINNDALGEIPKVGETIYYKYRVGGGIESNIGKNTLNTIGQFEMIINGDNTSINNSVKKSITVSNPIPALGGNDEPNIEYIRKMISYNFSSQNRCVTTRDYVTRVFQMSGRYGTPFRISASEINNKIVLSLLSLDNEYKLNNTSNSILKNNIASYLEKYKMINDYVEIEDGKIINLGVECDILIDRGFIRNEVNINVINVIKKYFDVNNTDLNENIYISDLIEKINNVNGVINVIDIRFINKYGYMDGVEYSQNRSSMETTEDTISNKKYIQLVDGTLFGETNGMFEIKYPNKDIILRNKIG